MKTTPFEGPYQLIDDPEDPNYEPSNTLPIVDVDGYVITDIYNAGEECLEEDTKVRAIATGHLLAASWDMLKALEEIVSHHKWCINRGESCFADNYYIDKCIEVINKAKNV